MKKQTILKGFHRPLAILPACFRNMSRKGHQIITKRLIFTDSCRYFLVGGDQADWNKLFGFCHGIRGIHRNSARFAWRYNVDHDTIDIAAYSYRGGFRTWNKIKELHIGREHSFEIERTSDGFVVFRIDGIFHHHEYLREFWKTAYGCGLYFGGNRRAPQKITILQK